MAPKLLIIIISFISLTIFYHPAQSICVPRNTSHVSPSPSPDHPSFNLQPVSSPMHAPAYPPKGESNIVAPTPTSVSPVESPDTDTETDNAAESKEMLFSDEKADFKPHSVLFPKILNVGKTDPAIENICKKTDYPALCLSSISPFFSGKTDAVAVLEMSIKACSQYANVAIAAAKKLVNAPTTPAQTASILNDCADVFSDALDNLQSAMDAMASRDIGTINSMLSAAVTDFGTCEDGFEGEVSPMTEFDSKLSNMASNCLAVASLI